MTFSNFSKVSNIGDLYSCPLDYFSFPTAQKQNYLDLDFHININSKLPDLVFGGGGMLHESFINRFEKYTLHPNRKKLIFWGAGINEHGLDKQYFPTFLNKFDMVGLRDYNNPWNYVPCVSCMHNAFDKIQHPITDFVIYDHIHCPISIKIESQFRKHNMLQNDQDRLENIIWFLSQGAAIISNSYHGIYWGLLMNRKVLVWNPFSNRFLGFKHQPTICNMTNWVSMLRILSPPPNDYRDECRDINIEYNKRVCLLLNN